jgi:hypothetical protein
MSWRRSTMRRFNAISSSSDSFVRSMSTRYAVVYHWGPPSSRKTPGISSTICCVG